MSSAHLEDRRRRPGRRGRAGRLSTRFASRSAKLSRSSSRSGGDSYGCRSTSDIRTGSMPPTSISTTTCNESQHRRPAVAASSPRSSRESPVSDSIATTRCGRCGSSKDSPTARSRTSRRFTTHSPTASPVNGCSLPRSPTGASTRRWVRSSPLRAEPVPGRFELFALGIADALRMFVRLPGLLLHTARVGAARPGSCEIAGRRRAWARSRVRTPASTNRSPRSGRSRTTPSTSLPSSG